MNITKKQFDTAQKSFSERKLSGAQKSSMLAQIYTTDSVSTTRSMPSPYATFFMFMRKKAFVGVVIVVLLLSGTSYASAQSLPGDLLYPMKTKVLEPIGLALQASADAKQEYNTKLLKKRVSELEQLEAQGGANERAQIESAEATQRTVTHLEEEENENNMGISTHISVYNTLIPPDLQIDSSFVVEIDTIGSGEVGIEESDKTDTRTATSSEEASEGGVSEDEEPNNDSSSQEEDSEEQDEEDIIDIPDVTPPNIDVGDPIL